MRRFDGRRHLTSQMTPHRFLVLLRGVNVGGKMLSMAALKDLAARLGYGEISTYIQSGNLILSAAVDDEDAIGRTLEKAIADDMGMTVSVLVRTPRELRAMADNNPLASRTEEPRRLHVTFLAESPSQALVEAIGPAAFTPDEFHVRDREVYLFCPNGYGVSKLGNAFWERALKVKATTRNWSTVIKLRELLET